jgi:hypothetical protein
VPLLKLLATLLSRGIQNTAVCKKKKERKEERKKKERRKKERKKETESSPKTPTTNFSIMYVWGPPRTHRAMPRCEICGGITCAAEFGVVNLVQSDYKTIYISHTKHCL